MPRRDRRSSRRRRRLRHETVIPDNLYIGFVEVERLSDVGLGDPADPKAAFTNVVGAAHAEDDFGRRIGDHFKHLGYRVVGLDDVRLVADRLRETSTLDASIADAIELAIDTGEFCTATWHTWKSDDEV